MSYIVKRLLEGPTWAGIALFFTGVTGIDIDKALMAQITQMGTALAGIVLAVFPNVFSKGAEK